MHSMNDRGIPTGHGTVLDLAAASGRGMLIRRAMGFLVDAFLIAGTVSALQVYLQGRGIAFDAFWIVPAWLYFPFCETNWGRTLGKVVAGTRVVRADAENPTTMQALGRAACLPLDASIVFVLLASVTRFRQRTGDLVAQTYVIRNDDYRDMKSRECLHGGKRTSPLMRGEP